VPRLTGIVSTLEGVGMALEAMRANKVRAATTTVGVALAVFVVVSMSAAIHGISKSVARDLASAGPASFYVSGVSLAVGDACAGIGETCPRHHGAPLTMQEAAAIARLESIEVVTSHLATTATFTYENRVSRRVRVDAFSANWVELDGGEIYPGRSFTAAENDSGARVVIVDERLAQGLSGGVAPLRRSVEINGLPFDVIGVYRYNARFLGKPGSLPAGNAPKAVIPLETARRDLGTILRSLDLTVRPRATASQAEAIHDVTALLRAHRGLGPAGENNFAVVTSDRLLEVYNGFFGVFFLIMLALSAVGLVAGGVGVVALMMSSVTERSREIGVRKALGATNRIILGQFLVEAATLTLVGALLGLAAGGLTATVVDRFTGIPASVRPGAIVAALLASALTGILFGLLPATRAARLTPIDALRYE